MDYAVIAKICHEILISSKVKIAFVNTIARYFADIDPSFNKKLFKKACDGKEKYESEPDNPDKMNLYRNMNALNGLKEATKKMSTIVKNTIEYEREDSTENR